MISLIEHDIIQNVGIGALALRQFTEKYFKEHQGLQGPSLALTMAVLPLLFHEQTLIQIVSKNFKGGFFKLMTDYRELPAGLQKRMESMSDQTFKSLNLAYKSKILTYDKELSQILPTGVNIQTPQYNQDIQKIIRGSERLGFWFATVSFEQVCINLKIKF